MTERELLDIIKRGYCAILSDKLVGIYVHGSIAFGCFNWDRSDIDFLVVVNSPLAQSEKESLISVLLKFESSAPPKGFEMSVVLESVCDPFVYPTPYELHFSNSYIESYKADLPTQCRSLNGTDKDLAAHFTVTRAVGFPLCGKPICEVFGEVPRANYIDSILYDAESAADEISRDPIYFTLNLCRVQAYLTDGLILSKEQGGKWGVEHLPCYAALINDARAAYIDGCEFTAIDDELKEFAADMLRQIKKKTTFKLITELTDKTVLGTEGIAANPSNTRKTSRAIVINKDGLYAVMYAKKFGLHSLPGGGIDGDETPEEALRREVLEETGCSCDQIEPLGIVKENRFHADYSAVSYYYVVHCFGEITRSQFTEAELAVGTTLKWCTLEETIHLIKDCIHTTNQRKFLQARDVAALAEYCATL